MLWYTCVFVVLLLFADITLYTLLQSSLLANLDTILQNRAQQVADSVSYTGGMLTFQDGINVDNNAVDQQGNVQDVNLQSLERILTATGQTFRVSPDFHKLLPPPASVAQPLHGSNWQGNVSTTDGQEVRLFSMALTEDSTTFAVVQVGEPLAQLNATLRSVATELLLIVPLLLLLSAIGGYGLAARAFTPIESLRRTAERIKAGDWQQRVPIPRARDEVQRLALTLNEMILAMDQALTQQRRFVANASHELRTPVAVIRSISDLALLQEPLTEEVATALQSINGEADRLSHLISDLLALARADEGQIQLEREPLRFDLLVGAVIANAEPLAAERGITLQIKGLEPVTLQGDEARLIQVIMNLLDNAITYTNPSGQVTMTLKGDQDHAFFVISDTGIGIAAEHLPYIFERFYRVDPARVHTEGNSSGLGLAIVDWIVRAHGGSVTVKSKPGQGSTFILALPLSAPAVASGGAHSQ